MDNFKEEWYEFKGIDQLDTPALIIYPQRVDLNIERLKAMVPSVDMLRPHVKTNKSVSASKLMLDQGINKFKCATIAEARMLGMSSAPDVLLAYQPSRLKLQNLIDLVKSFPDTKYSCLVDNLETAQMISSVSIAHSVVLPVFIDLNVGMDRTGIKPGPAFELYKSMLSLAGLEFKGFHAYDGHIRNVDLDERIKVCNSDFEDVENLRQRIENDGHPFPLLVAGGSPTFRIHSERKNAECSPGTFIFWDKGYHDSIPEQKFLFAALVANRVVSLPDETKVCIDLGYKSISSESSLDKRVFFLNAPDLVPYSQSEEHMVIEVGEHHNYRVGDIFYSLPFHICPTVAMYNIAFTVINGRLESKWSITSRGREVIDHS